MKSTTERFIERSAALDLSGIDFDDFVRQPLNHGALRTLRYMHDIEHHTVCYLRDLLVTPAHRDPEVTGFLSVWNYEELWHGRALARVLAAHGEPAGLERVAQHRTKLGIRDRLAPLGHSLMSAAAGQAFGAVHMTFGAVNEWTTQTGYALLAKKAGHPTLTDLLHRIMRQEGRHVAFYAGQAERRLASSERARKLSRWMLDRLWKPVGASVQPEAEVVFLADYLFADEAGRVALERIDRHIDTLPGLQGLHLLRRAREQYARAAA